MPNISSLIFKVFFYLNLAILIDNFLRVSPILLNRMAPTVITYLAQHPFEPMDAN